MPPISAPAPKVSPPGCQVRDQAPERARHQAADDARLADVRRAGSRRTARPRAPRISRRGPAGQPVQRDQPVGRLAHRAVEPRRPARSSHARFAGRGLSSPRTTEASQRLALSASVVGVHRSRDPSRPPRADGQGAACDSSNSSEIARPPRVAQTVERVAACPPAAPRPRRRAARPPAPSSARRHRGRARLAPRDTRPGAGAMPASSAASASRPARRTRLIEQQQHRLADPAEDLHLRLRRSPRRRGPRPR